ncbi:MAG: hypothetical protein ABL994_10510 [Verrucomicrobiales bacterium]
MIEPTPFERITEWCEAHQKPFDIRNHAFALFDANLTKHLRRRTKESGKLLSTREAGEITDAMLTSDSIAGYVATAESMVGKAHEALLRAHVIAPARRDGFWHAVSASIVANVIYAIGLIVLFYLGRDQIHSWLESLATQAP